MRILFALLFTVSLAPVKTSAQLFNVTREKVIESK